VAGYKMTLGADAPPTATTTSPRRLHLHRRQQHCLGPPDPVPPHRGRQGGHAADEDRLLRPRAARHGEIADLYLPIQPGTDVMLFHGLLHIMPVGRLERSRLHRAPTPAASTRSRRTCAIARPTWWRVCGIRKDDLLTGSPSVRTSPATLSLYCQGLNQSTSGTAKNAR
jgi:assimilatory nitrate reductase catalytic subunit